MAHGTAAEVVAKWQARLQQSSQEMAAGVQRVQVSPGQAAAAKRQKWVQAITDPKTQDKWARNVQSVSLSQWQQRMIDVGIPRVAQGAAAAQQKTEQAFSSLLSYIDNVQQQVRSMDDTTYEAREQRMIANARLMRQYQRPAS